MKNKCDKCGKPATIYLTEIVSGEKTEKHLCEDCAAEEGFTIKASVPISQLLEDFILQTAGDMDETELTCEVCGMTFSQFRQSGQLGCPNDYDAFEKAMVTLLDRAQGGATQHIGKVPNRTGGDQKKQNSILRLRAQLKGAIAVEDYERAAILRDQIRESENS